VKKLLGLMLTFSLVSCLSLTTVGCKTETTKKTEVKKTETKTSDDGKTKTETKTEEKTKTDTDGKK